MDTGSVGNCVSGVRGVGGGERSIRDRSGHRASQGRKIDDLRAFEHEYRNRLATYLDSQLQGLDRRGSTALTDPMRNQQGFVASGSGTRAEPGSHHDQLPKRIFSLEAPGGRHARAPGPDRSKTRARGGPVHLPRPTRCRNRRPVGGEPQLIELS